MQKKTTKFTVKVMDKETSVISNAYVTSNVITSVSELRKDYTRVNGTKYKVLRVWITKTNR